MFKDAAVQCLKRNLRGRLIVPKDADYGRARKVYNGMIDRYPRLIVRCADVADVIAAVRFAREHGAAARRPRRRPQRRGARHLRRRRW